LMDRDMGKRRGIAVVHGLERVSRFASLQAGLPALCCQHQLQCRRPAPSYTDNRRSASNAAKVLDILFQ